MKEKGLPRLRAQTRENNLKKSIWLQARGGDVADEAGRVAEKPYILQCLLVCCKEVGLIPYGLGTMKGFETGCFIKITQLLRGE